MTRGFLPFLTIAVIMANGCGTSSGNQRLSIGDIRSELDRRGCLIRMDDLAFELETGIYHERYTVAALNSVIASLPDSIGCCPGTASTYAIDGSDPPEIVCPLGHGSVQLAI
jgi:hypothetical protein